MSNKSNGKVKQAVEDYQAAGNGKPLHNPVEKFPPDAPTPPGAKHLPGWLVIVILALLAAIIFVPIIIHP